LRYWTYGNWGSGGGWTGRGGGNPSEGVWTGSVGAALKTVCSTVATTELAVSFTTEPVLAGAL
jgi:hypothetical protein